MSTEAMTLIEAFVLLQVLDVATTLIGLHIGGSELNPLIATLMRVTEPTIALMVAKSVGFGLGGYFIWRQKTRLIRRINIFFAALVTWNIIVIVAAVA